MKSRNHTLRASLTLLSALTMITALAACGADSGADGDEEVSVSMALVLTGLQYFQDEKDGAEAWASEDGNVDLDVTGPPGFDPTLAQKQVLDLLAKSPDAVGISPQPPDGWRRTIEQVVKATDGNVISYSEVPVVTAEDADDSLIRTIVGNADRELTRDMLEKTIELSGLDESTTGTAVLAPCTADVTGTQGRRLAGLEDAVKKMLPEVTIETFVTTPSNAQENYDLWANKLSAYPDAVLAAGACPNDADSLYKLKKQKNYSYAMGAMEMSPDILAGLRDGTILAANVSNTWLMGYTTARMLTMAARGEDLPEGFVGTAGSLITKDNVYDVDVRTDDPATYFKPQIDEMFANGMPEAEPIENAWQ